MKMFVFPREENAPSLNLEQQRPWVSPSIDSALVRLCTFMLAWTAGAGAAAFLAMTG